MEQALTHAVALHDTAALRRVEAAFAEAGDPFELMQRAGQSGWRQLLRRWPQALGTALVMQVHDELVLEVPEAEVEVIQHELPLLMTGVAKLDVPLAVDVGVGANWDEAH